MKLSILLLVLAPGVVDAFTTPHFQVTPSLSYQQQQHGYSSAQTMKMSLSSNNDKSKRRIWRRLNKSSQSSSSSSSIESTMSANLPSSSSSNRKSKLSLILQTLTHKLSNLTEVGKWRLAAITFLTSLYTLSPQIDVALVKFWNYLQYDQTAILPLLFRHDHWEWVVAISAFFFWIHGYGLIDKLVARADKKGIVHRWKKYRLQDQFEEEKFRRMQLRRLGRDTNASTNTNAIDLEYDDDENNKKMDIVNINIDEMKPPMTKQHKWNYGFWIFELPLYCLPLYIWDICIPRRAAKLAAWSGGAPTTFGICKDVTCGLLLYDFGFFICHYLMHKIPFFYKYVHAKHHKSTEVRASDIVRLSGVEEVVDVGISILALNFLKCHPVSRTIYNIIITFLLTELHSGYAFPWTPQFVVPFGLSTGSKGHHYHHRNGKHYYQKFFCHVDKLFGFVQKKDSSLQGSSV